MIFVIVSFAISISGCASCADKSDIDNQHGESTASSDNTYHSDPFDETAYPPDTTTSDGEKTGLPNNNSSVPNSDTSYPGVSIPSDLREVINSKANTLLKPSWEMASGRYSLKKSGEAQSNPIVGANGTSQNLIYFNDYTLGKSYVLCNKPNCKHNNTSCNAFFELPMGSTLNNCFLLIHEGNLFVYANNQLFRSSLNGSNKKAVLKVPDKYKYYGNGYIYEGKIYILVDYLLDSEDGEFKPITKNALMEIDLTRLSVKELWAIDSTEEYSNHLLGVYDDKSIIFQRGNGEVMSGSSQQEFDKAQNTIKRKIISINHSGKATSIADTTGYYMDYEKMFGNFLLYHSRKDNTLYSLNLITNKTTGVLTNLKGYILIENIMDNKLIYTVLNTQNDIKAQTSQTNIRYFLDLKTGNIQKSSLLVDIDKEYDGYYYFVVNSKDRQVQIGRLKKEDYFADRINKVENLYWVDAREYNTGA